MNIENVRLIIINWFVFFFSLIFKQGKDRDTTPLLSQEKDNHHEAKKLDKHSPVWVYNYSLSLFRSVSSFYVCSLFSFCPFIGNVFVIEKNSKSEIANGHFLYMQFHIYIYTFLFSSFRTLQFTRINNYSLFTRINKE